MVNGLLVSRVNITPIVVTLATNAVLLGAVRTISGGSPMSAPDALAVFSHQTLFGIPMTLVLALLFIAFISFATKRTVYGRRFVAVGANPAAAAAAGIPVLRYQVGTYAVAAVCFAVAGMLFTGFIGSASQTAGNDYLLPAIAAVVVGGTPFTGGRGSVIASGVAALFMVQLGQMVLALGAGTAVQLLVQALAIILAVTIGHLPALLRRKSS
jgi:ribose transport system permease protein